ncbi:MAG: class I SAM-dependent methyltransferase [Ignavibacteria bacterium]
MFSRVKSYFLQNADQNNEDSISSHLRKKRFEFFKKYTKDFNKPLKILDLGGSDYYWKNIGCLNDDNYKITILNIHPQELNGLNNTSFIEKDARDLSFIKDNEYDIIYSNSMIEHLNNFEEQKLLAKEIQRIGKKYFIQTPNYYFPVEPHFLFPFFQYLPVKIKSKLISKYDLGWYKMQADKKEAYKIASSIRLLKKNELLEIFPGCKIYCEKYFSLDKSFIVYN